MKIFKKLLLLSLSACVYHAGLHAAALGPTKEEVAERNVKKKCKAKKKKIDLAAYWEDNPVVEAGILETPAHVHAFSWSPEGTRIACALANGQIAIVGTNIKQTFYTLGTAGSKRIRAVCWVPGKGGNLPLVSGGDDTNICVWDTVLQKCTATLRDGHQHPVQLVACSHDKKFIASACDNKICIWDVKHQQCLRRFTGCRAQALAWSPEHNMLICTTNTHIYRFLSQGYNNYKLLDTHPRERYLVPALHCPHNEIVAFNDYETVAIRDLSAHACQARVLAIATADRPIIQRALAPHKKYTATLDTGGRVTLWEPEQPIATQTSSRSCTVM